MEMAFKLQGDKLCNTPIINIKDKKKDMRRIFTAQLHIKA